MTNAPSRFALPDRHRQTLTQRTLIASLWSAGGSSVQAGLRVLVLMVLARLLTPEDFGVTSIAMTVIALTDLFSILGVAPAIVQKKDLTDADISTGMIVSVVLGSATGCLIAVLAPYIADFFNAAPLLTVMPLLALTFPLKGLSVVSSALLQRQLRIKETASAAVASYVFGYALVAITLAFNGYGLWSLVFGQLTQSAINTAWVVAIARPRLSLQLQPATVRHLLLFGRSYSVARIGNYLAVNGDTLLVGRLLGTTAAGLYSRAYQFLMIPTNLLGGVIDQVLLPAMLAAGHDDTKLARAYERAVGVIAMVMLPSSAILIATAPTVIELLLGPQWASAIQPFQIFAATLVCRTAYKISDALWKAKGVVTGGAWRQCVYALEVLIATWCGSFWGVTGVATGVALAIVAHYVTMLAFANSLLPISTSRIAQMHVRHMFVALACGGAAWLGGETARDWSSDVTTSFFVSILAASAAGAFLWLTAPRLFGPERTWAVEQVRRLTRKPSGHI